VKKLTDLFAERSLLPMEEQKDYIRLRLPQTLAGSHLKLWRLDDPVTNLPRRVLIGIATWSRYDLKLIDSLVESLNWARAADEQIYVFDVDEVVHLDPQASRHGFERYIPGIGKVFNSPVVGIWENGVLRQKATGSEARKLIADRYKLHFQ
jgi:hypothetical protein